MMGRRTSLRLLAPARGFARGGWRAGWRPAALGLCWLLAGPAGAEDAYRIAAGDELQLDVLDDEAEPYPLKVGLGGEVQLPFVGTMEVAGRPVEAARDAIAAFYVEREIFVAPRIDLLVTRPRPVSVLGDVHEPGLYDHAPFLTVEQAVGLAGGTRASGIDEETRSLQRAALRAELAAAEGQMAQEAVAGARLRAQLAGANGVRPADVGPALPPGADPALVASLVEQENAILLAERENHLAQLELLDRSIAEATDEITLTEQQIATQADQVASYGGELESSTELNEQGLMAAPVLARLQRQVADEERTLLQLRTNLAGTQRLLSGLERERRSLAFGREQAWREGRVQSEVRGAQLAAERRSLIERLRLLDDWVLRGAGDEGAAPVAYVVRRRGPEGPEEERAGPTDELGPGDVLVVALGEGEEPDPVSDPGSGGAAP